MVCLYPRRATEVTPSRWNSGMLIHQKKIYVHSRHDSQMQSYRVCAPFRPPLIPSPPAPAPLKKNMTSPGDSIEKRDFTIKRIDTRPPCDAWINRSIPSLTCPAWSLPIFLLFGRAGKGGIILWNLVSLMAIFSRRRRSSKSENSKNVDARRYRHLLSTRYTYFAFFYFFQGTPKDEPARGTIYGTEEPGRGVLKESKQL